MAQGITWPAWGSRNNNLPEKWVEERGGWKDNLLSLGRGGGALYGSNKREKLGASAAGRGLAWPCPAGRPAVRPYPTLHGTAECCGTRRARYRTIIPYMYQYEYSS